RETQECARCAATLSDLPRGSARATRRGRPSCGWNRSFHSSDLILRSPSEARASRRMAASPNLLPWFETARCARLLTMRLRVLELHTEALSDKLLRADPGQLDHAGPGIDRAFEEGRRIGNLDRVRLIAQLPHALIDGGIPHDCIHISVQLGGDLRRDLGR